LPHSANSRVTAYTSIAFGVHVRARARSNSWIFSFASVQETARAVPSGKSNRRFQLKPPVVTHPVTRVSP